MTTSQIHNFFFSLLYYYHFVYDFEAFKRCVILPCARHFVVVIVHLSVNQKQSNAFQAEHNIHFILFRRTLMKGKNIQPELEMFNLSLSLIRFVNEDK